MSFDSRDLNDNPDDHDQATKHHLFVLISHAPRDSGDGGGNIPLSVVRAGHHKSG
jgi:hypothetical protein